MNISGAITSVLYHDKNNGYTVMRIDKGMHVEETVVCNMPKPHPGEHYSFTGQYGQSKHGEQFEADAYKMSMPTTTEGIQRYLEKGPIKGVGTILASRIVARFGLNTFDIIDKSPEKLLEVTGITPNTLTGIKNSWQASRGSAEAISFCTSLGMTPDRAMQMLNKYGKELRSTIENNPYTLAQDFKGVGFDYADQIAGQQGIIGADKRRVAAGLANLLSEAMRSGHSGVLYNDMIRNGSRLLNVSSADVKLHLDLMVGDGRLAAVKGDHEVVIMTPGMRRCESFIAGKLKSLVGTARLKSDLESAIKMNPFQLEAEQMDALKKVTENRVAIVTGGPGVGKTTIISTAINAFQQADNSPRIMLAAPTGRAAQRMQESTGTDAKTIHRLLQFANGNFHHNGKNPLPVDLLIVDEVSMVDVPLMASLLSAIPGDAHLILVGDKDQLPSVGPGSVLRDLLSSEQLPTAMLTKPHRTGAGSGISNNAHAVNNGNSIFLYPDFAVYSDPDISNQQAHLVHQITDVLPKKLGLRAEDIQVLTPSHKGEMGTVALNALLRNTLNPHPSSSVHYGNRTFSLGDKVMQVKNNYSLDIFNGDSGFITNIDHQKGAVTVDFGRKTAVLEKRHLSNLAHAYAITVHKSQGSEYPAVVIPVSSEHMRMNQRNLLYTAMTRAKKHCTLIESPGLIDLAIMTNPEINRVTTLTQTIEVGFGVKKSLPASPDDQNADKAVYEMSLFTGGFGGVSRSPGNSKSTIAEPENHAQRPVNEMSLMVFSPDGRLQPNTPQTRSVADSHADSNAHSTLNREESSARPDLSSPTRSTTTTPSPRINGGFKL